MTNKELDTYQKFVKLLHAVKQIANDVDHIFSPSTVKYMQRLLKEIGEE